MKTTSIQGRSPRNHLSSGLAVMILLSAISSTLAQQDARVMPANSKPYGKSYAEWSAALWKWGLEYPLTGHPYIDDPAFDFSARQSGPVWFVAAPEGIVTRTVSMPAGKALFLTMRNVEVSSLEAPPFFGATEAEQREGAKFWADHIVDVFCVIDGKPVANAAAYRFSSPQFAFNAPTPWIFGATGGTGTAVGDGYYLMLAPLAKGKHTIQFGGTFHFDAGELAEDPIDLPLEMTLELTVE